MVEHESSHKIGSIYRFGEMRLDEVFQLHLDASDVDIRDGKFYTRVEDSDGEISLARAKSVVCIYGKWEFTKEPATAFFGSLVRVVDLL